MKPTLQRHAAVAVLLLAVLSQSACAGSLRDRLAERRGASAPADALDDGTESNERAAAVLAGTRLVRDVAYGSDPRQRFDVYAPQKATQAPVIFMVHGGGWSRGDKAMRAVVENKVARWVPRGFIVISANYRMRPDTAPIEQAADVARALAAAQQQAATWGGDATKFVLMGHSAGSHLVSLLNASPAIAREQGAAPWLGTVALDSAAFDVVQIMQARHARLYDRAFGRDPNDWKAASPYHVLTSGTAPLLAVCSTRRDVSCEQARRFASKAASLGAQVSVLERDLSHGDINQRLGESGDYTVAVERFLSGLDASIAQSLASR